MARARSRPRVSPCLGRVRPTPRTTSQVFRCDLTWLTSARPASSARVPGHLRRPPRRRLLHPGCALHRRRRRAARRVVRRAAHAGGVAVPPAASRRDRRLGRDRRGRRAQDRRGRTTGVGVHLPQPARLRHRRRLRPARTGARAGPQPARDQARRLLAAADPAHVPHRRAPRRHVVPRGHDRRVRPPRLGTRRPRPRLVLLGQHRGARRRRAGLRHPRARADRADGRRGLRRAGAPLRRPRARRARPSRCTPPTRADARPSGTRNSLDVKTT